MARVNAEKAQHEKDASIKGSPMMTSRVMVHPPSGG